MIELYILIFIIGNIIGSFLNVCIHRIPRNESVVYPPSHCPNCGYKINWYDNIPIISYFLLLRGKCRKCKNKISIQYPLIEILTGFVFVAIFYRFGLTLPTIKFWIYGAILITLAIIDLKTYILPNRLTFSLIILGFILSFIDPRITIFHAFIGASVYNFPFLILFIFGKEILKKDIMGFGDVKLGMGIGAFLGYTNFINFYMFFMLSFVIGAVISLILMALKIKNRKDMIPFGPFIALAGFIVLFL
ncbi:MAG: prepilin peptidase [Fusobacteriota bacterium]